MAYRTEIVLKKGDRNKNILLEVPPKPKAPLTDEQLLKRIGGLYSKDFVATVAKELAGALVVVAQGLAADGEAYLRRVHERFTYEAAARKVCSGASVIGGFEIDRFSHPVRG